MMKPKAQNKNDVGLLEYLEDIIGSDKYLKPIEDTEVELEKLDDFRVQVLNRVNAVQKDLTGLEEAKNEAELYLKLEKEIIDKKSIFNSIIKYKS